MILDDFNIEALESIKDRLEDDILVCDIGGFRGEFAIECLRLFPKKINKILIFEPLKSNYEQIKIDDKKVKVINKGIFYGSKCCTPKGTGDGNMGGMMVGDIDLNHIYNDIQKNNLRSYDNVIFELDTLESYISSEDKLGIAKLDVEASEYNIVEKSEILKKFPYLIVEWHNHSDSYVKKFISEHLPDHSVLNGNGRHALLAL